MSNNPPLSIAELCELKSGAWVDDGFTGVVDSLESKTAKKTGRPFTVAMIADTNGQPTVECAIFKAVKFRVGDTIEVTGQGIKFEVGQYGPKVSFGDKAEIHVIHAGAAVRSSQPATRAPVDDSRGGGEEDTPEARYQAALERGQQRQPTSRPNPRAGDRPPQTGNRPAPIKGERVGAAVNNAVAILIHNAKHAMTPGPVDLVSLEERVVDVASQILRASGRLEAGELSDPGTPTAI